MALRWAIHTVACASLCTVGEAITPALVLLQIGAKPTHNLLWHEEVLEEKPLSDRGVFAIADDTCIAQKMPSSEDWAKNDTRAQKIMSTWHAIMPKGLVQRDFGNDDAKQFQGSCLDKLPVPSDPQREKRHVLTIVGDYVNDSPKLCPKAGRKAYKRFRVIEPKSFDVSATSLNKRAPAAPNRNYATVWPLNDACTKEKKCPLVVYLHGRDEHAETADLNAAREMFKLVGVWGFLRYAERDEICAQQLGSVLLFPQILVGESWVANNLELMSSFVLPLVNQLQTKFNNIDFQRISIVGYSEGALGALQAVVWHPDVFTFALASACALPTWENVTLPDKPKVPSDYENWKLKGVVVTFGHWDEIGTVQDNMRNVSKMMTMFGADKLVDTHYRVYTEANHDHWENAFNQWSSLHDMLWFGNYAGHGLDEVAVYQQRQLINTQRPRLQQMLEEPSVVEDKPLSDSGVLAIADGTCVAKNMPTSEDWAKNDTRAQKIMDAWHEIMPNGLVQRDFGNNTAKTFQGSCLDKMPELSDPHRDKRHVLTIVGDYVNDSPKLCPKAGRKAYKRFRVIEPKSFDVSATSLNKRAPAAPNRNYATVWPLNDACTEEKKCPLVVYLHGRDEHADTADLNAAREMFKLVGVWGFLRYAERDEICAQQLGSVLLFPQILVGESWVANNVELMTSFVLPLLRSFQTKFNNIDFQRISIVGYSEGALGALQAVLWHPGVFTFALASACALPSWENVTMPDKPKVPSDYATWKLKSIVVTFGHWDEIGTVQDNMRNVSKMMNMFGADKLVDTHYRVYTEANHDHWENAFNQWPSLHDMLWFGNYAGHGMDEIAEYQKHVLIHTERPVALSGPYSH